MAAAARPTSPESGCTSPTAPPPNRWQHWCRRRANYLAPQRIRPLCDRAAAVAEVAETERQLLQQCGNGKPIPGNTQTCDYPAPQPMKVYAGLGHTHA
jgi:hypothetical protein